MYRRLHKPPLHIILRSRVTLNDIAEMVAFMNMKFLYSPCLGT